VAFLSAPPTAHPCSCHQAGPCYKLPEKTYLCPYTIVAMGLKSWIIKPLAKKIARDIAHMAEHAVAAQERVFQNLVEKGRRTAFGRDHGFADIRTYEDF